MHVGEEYLGRPEPAGATAPARRSRLLRRAGPDDHPVPPAARRWRAAAAWIGSAVALFAVLLRISLSRPVTSDGANNALQAWDMLHGNLLLHGWIIGDATFYTFELPLYALTESVLGLHTVAVHVGAVLTYLIVAACAVALARTNSRGASAAARSALVVAVLAAPLVTANGVAVLLEEPDHVGTSAIVLGCFLLADRAAGRRFMPPLLCVILCAGQLSDATVRYVAVPAILVVCVYRILAARRIRTTDTAVALAAAASVPLASLLRAALLHFGAYAMVPPVTKVAPAAQWPHHLLLTLRAIQALFEPAASGPGAPLGKAGAAFGLACLAAAAFGFVKVVWTWTRATRAEQLLCVAIVVNCAVYAASVLAAGSNNSREIAVVLPAGAVLAARACVPAGLAGARRALVALTAAGLAATAPLVAAAVAQPPATSDAVSLAAWLQAHRLSYGIAGYWEASAVTLQSGNQVQIRAVAREPGQIAACDWEMKSDWYTASLHDATFVIARQGSYLTTSEANLTVADFTRAFGRPVLIHRVAGSYILVYRTNLLDRVAAHGTCFRRRPHVPPRRAGQSGGHLAAEPDIHPTMTQIETRTR